ncbi:MAG TPA: hypothetical protein V6C81_24230 [Planktothrix sp.]
MKSGYAVLLSTIVMIGSAAAALAHDDDRPGSLDIRSGYGEEIYLKHGLLGNKETAVKDRLGDEYVNKKGILGGEDKSVNVFGNGYEKHRGIFGLGGTKVEAQTMLGDKMYSHKTFFGLGPRQTTVDLSGVSSVAQGLIGKLHQQVLMPDGNMMAPGMMSPGMTAPGAGAPSVNSWGMPYIAPTNPLDAAAGLAPSTPLQNP